MRLNLRRFTNRLCRASAKRRRRPAAVGWPTGQVSIEHLENRALLATITVTSLEDAGSGTLREAIATANLDQAADTIEFDPSISGRTISLSAELVITSPLSINGNAENLITIAADGSSRIFRIDDGNDAGLIDVTISGLHLTGGAVSAPSLSDGGGAIRSVENLSVVDSRIDGNTAFLGGAIYLGDDTARLSVRHTTIDGNTATAAGPGLGQGGGIFSVGSTSIIGSTISRNIAALNGGGLAHSGTAIIANSTIALNRASFSGGGIHSTLALTMINSTVAGNRVITSSRGGGIFSNGVSTLRNTIVAGNFTETTFIAVENDFQGDGIVENFSHNLVGPGSREDVGSFFIWNAVIESENSEVVLKNNGGPTETVALVSDSPAIDAGENSFATSAGLTHDQRGSGFDRIIDGDQGPGQVATIDIGAVESKRPASLAIGNVDGDQDFDANDSFLILLTQLSGSDDQINQSKGSSSLTATEIRGEIDELSSAGDVDGDQDFDANDAFLIHLVQLAGADTQIDQSKGSSPLSASQIRANVSALHDAPPAPSSSGNSGPRRRSARSISLQESPNDQFKPLDIETSRLSNYAESEMFRDWIDLIGSA